MVIEDQIELLSRISEIVGSAGVANQIDKEDQRLVITFTLEPGCTHLVYVQLSKTVLDGRPAITFSSPCAILKNGSASAAGLEPVSVNEYQAHASYEVLESSDLTVVVASLDHSIDDLNEDQLLKSVACVALAAESYEKSLGDR